MMGLVTAVERTSLGRVVAVTAAAGASAGISFFYGVHMNKAHDLQRRTRTLAFLASIVLHDCASERPEAMAEREKLRDELRSREASTSGSRSARLKHVLEPWHLHLQMLEARKLHVRALSLFRKTCDLEDVTDSEADVADNTPEHFWQGKLRSTMHLLSITSDQIWW